jgi:hypothetical protein
MRLIMGWIPAWIRALRRRQTLILCLVICLILLLIWLRYLLPRHAIAEIGRLTNTAITTERCEIDYRGWVSLYGLTVRPRGVEPYENALLQAQEVRVSFSWSSLWRRRPRVELIRVNRFQCSILYDPNERIWNTRGITFSRSGMGASAWPQVQLENGTLRYLRVANRKPQTILSIPFDLGVSPVPGQPRTAAIDIQAGAIAEGFGGSRLTGLWQDGRVDLTGGISVTDLPGTKRTWSVPDVRLGLTYDTEGRGDLKIRLLQAQAVHTPETLALDWLTPLLSNTSGMFTRLQGFIDRYRPDGRINLDLATQVDLNRLADTKLQVTVACLDVSIHDRRFPYRLDHLQGEVHINQNGLTGEGLTARHGDALIQLDFNTRGFGGDWQYDVRMACENLALDRDLYAALSPRHQAMWDGLNPTGTVWIDNRQRRLPSGEQLRILQVRPLGIHAAYRDFPYPLENMTGELRFEPHGATLTRLIARRGQSTIILNGTVDTPVDQPVIVDLQAAVHALALDETLIQALPEAQREKIRAMHLQGQIDAQIQIAHDPNGPHMATYRADIQADGLSLRPPRWQRDVSEIKLQATLTPSLITLHSAKGFSGRSPVSIAGPIRFAGPSAPSSYRLSIRSKAMRIADLIDGLSNPARQRLQSLRATGPLLLDGQVEGRLEDSDPNYRFILKCQNIKARPQAWPYPLRAINGTLHFDRERLVIERLTAAPDVHDCPSQAQLDLTGTLALQGGQWQEGRLVLAARKVPLDKELLATLPSSWQTHLDPCSVDGLLTLEPSQIKLSRRQDQFRWVFGGRVALEDSRLRLTGIPLEANAVADMQLSHEQGQGLQEGRLSLDSESLRIHGKTARNIQSVLAYDPESRTWTTENLTGDFYGGRLMGMMNLQWIPGEPTALQMRLGISNARLHDFLSEARAGAAQGSEASRGILAGSLSLGWGRGPQRVCIGHCQLSVQDMQLGAQSPLSKVLANLRGYAKDDIHFDRLFINAYIQDRSVHFQRFDISGRSLALQGAGALDLTTNWIQLDLVTRGIRHPTADPKLLQSLSEGLGGAVIRMQVTGDPMRPEVATKTLPVLGDTLRILGATN